MKNDLLKTIKERGARHPKDPFKILPPTHPYTKIKIQLLQIQAKEGEITDADFQRVKKLDKKLEEIKLKL